MPLSPSSEQDIACGRRRQKVVKKESEKLDKCIGTE